MPPRILIAEDNDSFASVLETLLRRKGLATERVAGGVEALQRILAAPPDLLLLDLKLPGLHGIELLKKLRQSPATRALPVVVVTGVYKGEKYVQAARALGVAEYLEKPVKTELLLAALKRALAPGSPTLASASRAPEARPSPSRLRIDQVLLKAFNGRFSGSCRLASENGEKTLVFVQGLPVALRPAFTCADFGDYLRRRGLISSEEYAFYCNGGGHRHEVLVQMGCLDYPGLLQEKLAYLSGQLVEAFELPAMGVTEAPFECPAALQLITVNVPQIFYQGYRRLASVETTRRLLTSHGSQYPAVTPSYYRYINFLTLTGGEKALLPRFDGLRMLNQCLEGENDPGPLLRTLTTLGMIRFDDGPLAAAQPTGFPLRTLFNAVVGEEELEEVELEQPLESFTDLVDEEIEAAPPIFTAPAPPAGEGPSSGLAAKVRKTHSDLKGKNYYEVFGLTQGTFSFDRLKERYFALTREFGPEVLMELSGEESSLVEEILSTVSNAYGTLSDVVKKERYDELLGSDKIGLGREGDDRFQAQVQFQSGKVFLDMEEWDNAEKALQDACNIDNRNGEYLANLAWAIYRNPRNVRSRAMQDKARQMLNRSLTLERNAAGFAYKGWMLMEGGQDALAEAEFTKALKLDARHTLARRGLRELQEKREQQKKGLFGRMFR